MLIIMQDDQLPPESCTWLKYTLRQFNRWPRLGAIGFRNAHLFWPVTLYDGFFKEEYAKQKARGENGAGVGSGNDDGYWGRCRYGQRYLEENVFRDGDVPFEFVANIDTAPVRRTICPRWRGSSALGHYHRQRQGERAPLRHFPSQVAIRSEAFREIGAFDEGLAEVLYFLKRRRNTALAANWRSAPPCRTRPSPPFYVAV